MVLIRQGGYCSLEYEPICAKQSVDIMQITTSLPMGHIKNWSAFEAALHGPVVQLSGWTGVGLGGRGGAR